VKVGLLEELFCEELCGDFLRNFEDFLVKRPVSAFCGVFWGIWPKRLHGRWLGNPCGDAEISESLDFISAFAKDLLAERCP